MYVCEREGENVGLYSVNIAYTYCFFFLFEYGLIIHKKKEKGKGNVVNKDLVS